MMGVREQSNQLASSAVDAAAAKIHELTVDRDVPSNAARCVRWADADGASPLAHVAPAFLAARDSEASSASWDGDGEDNEAIGSALARRPTRAARACGRADLRGGSGGGRRVHVGRHVRRKFDSLRVIAAERQRDQQRSVLARRRRRRRRPRPRRPPPRPTRRRRRRRPERRGLGRARTRRAHCCRARLRHVATPSGSRRSTRGATRTATRGCTRGVRDRPAGPPRCSGAASTRTRATSAATRRSTGRALRARRGRRAAAARRGARDRRARRRGRDALHWACEQGHEAVARQLLDARADVERKDQLGNTPLMVAVDRSRAAIVRMLIADGCDQDAPNHVGVKPLQRAACVTGDVEIVRLLLDSCASTRGLVLAACKTAEIRALFGPKGDPCRWFLAPPTLRRTSLWQNGAPKSHQAHGAARSPSPRARLVPPGPPRRSDDGSRRDREVEAMADNSAEHTKRRDGPQRRIAHPRPALVARDPHDSDGAIRAVAGGRDHH